MNKFWQLFPGVLFALTMLGTPSATRAQTYQTAELSGDWEGQMLLRSNWRFMEARFGRGGDPAEVKVDLPQERREFRDFERQGNRLQWNLLRGTARIRFEGTLNGDVIRGSADQDGVAGEFQLVRIDRRSAPSEVTLAGTYGRSPAPLVSIVRFDFGDGIDRLGFMDSRDGYWGTLLPVGNDKYVLAPARSGRFPVDLRLEFKRDANGDGNELTMITAGGQRRTGRRVDAYETHDVVFRNGDITLGGTVVLPRSEGPHPAVVMVHSSGNQSRNGPVGYFRLIANLLAANGVVTLVYDKRGVGESTGSWTSATFEDLAGDLRAAVVAVRSEPGVDPRRVGLWTLSQGGWIAPIVAADDRDIAFLALVSAAATTPAQQEIERVAMVMKANGAGTRDVEAATRYMTLFFEVVNGRQSWEVLQSAMTTTASEGWIQYVPRPRTERELGWTPVLASFDPAPLVRKIAAPILALHGAEDVDVRATTNSALLARVSSHSSSRQRVFKGADHYMLVTPKDPDRNHRRLSEGYVQMTIDWIKQVSRP